MITRFPQLAVHQLRTEAGFAECCRLSRALCAAAQSHLFHSIAIRPSRNFLRRIGRPFIFPLNEVASCRRLRALLAESPHLIRYIRRIEITLHEDVIAEIPAMELLLESIQFRTGTETFLAEVDDRAARANPPAPLGYQTSRAAFHLSGARISHAAVLSVDAAAEHLGYIHERLVHPPTIARWLLDADCPFDLTALTHPDVSSSMCPEVAQILKTASGTLRHLTLAPDSCVDLRLVPRLTHLNPDAPTERDILMALPLLETLDPVNAVREITLTLAQHGEKLTAEELVEVRRNFEARLVMSVAWLKAKKSRSQSHGFVKPSQAKLMA
ncbi:hypothetical protein B0H11DRAFT_2213759 [Mycena galericulata]|nr:hypothetical protein B0H11DRAFT_2213759 [Mycena galericulata]